jgi:hypothetical protein
MSENALALNNQQGAIVDEGFIGLERPEELKPSEVVLKQPTTEGLDEVLIGKFAHRDTGMVFDRIQFVPLLMHPTRLKWPGEKYKKGDKPLCVSRDGKFPIVDSEYLVPQAANCTQCKHASWDGWDRKTGSGKKPDCSKGFYILFIERTLQMPFYIKLSGKSVAEAANLHRIISQNAIIWGKKDGIKYNLFDFVVDMDSVKIDGAPAYKVRFPKVLPLKPEEREKFGWIYNELVRKPRQVQTVIAANSELDDVAEAELIDSRESEIRI